MAYYLASDVHLRPDQPGRDRRFSAWVGRLTPADSLVIVGDLCDFWMATRQSDPQRAACRSLQALAEFRRQGGELAIMAGNHDTWLCEFYTRALGARILTEPHDLTIGGLRIRLIHGHLLGANPRWKAWMESRAFFRLFGLLPGMLARPLDRLLAWKNQRSRPRDEERHLQTYRDYAAACRDRADLVVVGHVHRRVDESQSDPRLIVLGGWQQQSSYLRIDAQGVDFSTDGQEASVDRDNPTAMPCRPS